MSEKKTRNRKKTFFMASIVQDDGALKVVKGGFNSYLEAERWCKNEAGNELGFNQGIVKFFIFHAKNTIEVAFTSADENDSTAEFEGLIEGPEEVHVESPLPEAAVNPADMKQAEEAPEPVPVAPAMPENVQQANLPGMDGIDDII